MEPDARFRPLAALRSQSARPIRGLIFDLDDTFLHSGQLQSHSLAALERWRAAGGLAILCTGRPLGWGRLLARLLPLDLAIVENGALALQPRQPRARVLDALDLPKRAARSKRLDEELLALQACFPWAQVPMGRAERVSDRTIDVGEAVTIAPEEVQAAVAWAQARGLRTSVSSVHMHISLDIHDKASGSVYYLNKVFGIGATAIRNEFAFIGDSGNDASAFAAFPTSIGVANCREHLHRFSLPPAYVTPGESAEGFSQAVEALLKTAP